MQPRTGEHIGDEAGARHKAHTRSQADKHFPKEELLITARKPQEDIAQAYDRQRKEKQPPGSEFVGHKAARDLNAAMSEKYSSGKQTRRSQAEFELSR